MSEELACRVEELYCGKFSCVRANSCITDWISVESGVYQACIVSPVLFNALIDYLKTTLTEAKVVAVKFKDSFLQDLKNEADIAF